VVRGEMVILGKARPGAHPVRCQPMTRYLVIRLDEGTLHGALLCVAMGCLAIVLGVVETVGRSLFGGEPP
jgi:hypothetical protein